MNIDKIMNWFEDEVISRSNSGEIIGEKKYHELKDFIRQALEQQKKELKEQERLSVLLAFNIAGYPEKKALKETERIINLHHAKNIEQLRTDAKEKLGLNLDRGNDKPHKKPLRCEHCNKKYKLYLFRSNLENNWIWACKRCERRMNYEFYYLASNPQQK